MDPNASSTASEPIEASEAGELMGSEQVESAVSCVMAPSVAGDTDEARAAVKSRIGVRKRSAGCERTRVSQGLWKVVSGRQP